MKIKLKKKLLFEFLKKHMNENRTLDNPSGNFISVVQSEKPSFDLFDKEDTPIEPSQHMAVQLSVDQPPVDDPDYVPASTQELANAASFIAKEVPPGQIDFFYRKLHALLDSSLDQNDMLSESINLLNESETMRDKLLQSAAKKVRLGYGDSYTYAQGLVDDYVEFEDDDPMELSMTIDNMSIEDLEATQKPKPAVVKQQPAKTIQRRPSGSITSRSGDFVVRKAKKTPDEKLPDEGEFSTISDVEDLLSFSRAQNKNEYLAGFNDAQDKEANIQVDIPEPMSDDYRLGFEEYMKQANRDYNQIEDIAPKRQSYGDLVIDLIDETHSILFDISREVEQEYFDTHFTKAGQEAQKLGKDISHLQASTQRYGITNKNAFTVLNLTKKESGQFVYSVPRLIKQIKSFINNYVKLPEGIDYNQTLLKIASDQGKTKEETIDFIAQILANKYAEEREDMATLPDDEFLNKKIENLFTVITKKEPYKFSNISVTFMNRATPDLLEPLIDDMLNSVAKNKKSDKYQFKSNNKLHTYEIEEFESALRFYAKGMFDQAEEHQRQKAEKKAAGVRVDDETEMSVDEKEAQSFARKIARLATTTNFDNLAPFFGFSSASGLRQWYLKHALRKLKTMGAGIVKGNKGAFAKLYEETLEAIAPYLSDAIAEKLKKLDNNQNLTNQEKFNQNVLRKALPQVGQLVDLFDEDKFFNASESGTPEGHDLLYTVGGYILRTINSDIYKPIMNLIDKDWTEFVAKYIESKGFVDFKKAKSIAEYFTGKKEIPNYETMTKAAKNLLKVGINFDDFESIIKVSNDWFDDTLSTQFSKFKGEDGSFFQGDFLETIMKTIEKISKNPKVIEGYLDKAVKSYLDDLSYQITFKKLSQMETKTGD